MTDLFASGSTWNTASNWGLTSGASDGTVPGSSDRVICDSNSVSMTMDASLNPTIDQLELRTGFTATLDVNDNNLTISGLASVLIDAGTLDMGNGTWLLNRDSIATVWEFNGGTVNAEGSLVKLTTRDRTIDSGTMIFNDVEIDQPSNRNVLITGTMFIAGKLTITSSGGMLNGTVDLKGDLVCPDTTGAHTTLVKLTTATSQDVFVDKAGGDGRFPRIEIDAVGTINLFDIVRVFANATATNWKYTAGTVVVGTAKVIFDNNTSTTFTVNDETTNFNDVEFSTRDTNGNITITGTLKCDGDLTIVSGNNFAGTVDLKGDLISSASVLISSGVVRMIGTTPQKIKVDEAGGSGIIPPIEFASSSTVTLFDNLEIKINNVGNFITNTSGIIDAGTGTVIFNKNETGIGTIDAGSIKFNNVIYNCTDVNGDISITGTLDVDGDFTITGVDNANGAITVAGNLKSTDATVTGTGTITMDGSGVQTIDMNGGAARLPNGTLTIANTGTVQLSNGDLNLNATGQDMVINASSRFCTGGNDLTVDDTITNNGMLQKFAGDTISPDPGNVITVTSCGQQVTSANLIDMITNEILEV